METRIEFVVVRHHSREQQTRALTYQIGPSVHVMIDPEDYGAAWNHRRAPEWAAKQDYRMVITEDDAIPATGFEAQVVEWLSRFPNTLYSFYLDTDRSPHYQLGIATGLIAVDRIRADHISLLRPVHAVCYSVPVNLIQKVLTRWDPNRPADYAVGDAHDDPVVYPCYSLVDYTDGKPVEKHPDGQHRNERRRAWRFYGQTDDFKVPAKSNRYVSYQAGLWGASPH